MSVRRATIVFGLWLLASAGGLFVAHADRPFSNDLSSLVANLEAAHASRLTDEHLSGGEHESLLYCVRGTTSSTTTEVAPFGYSLDHTCDAPAALAEGVRQVDSGFLSATPRILLLE